MNQLRIDPTRTTLIQKGYAADLKRRFKSLAYSINDLIVVDDAFGLSNKGITTHASSQIWAAQSDAAKLKSFKLWLKGQVDKGLLETVDGNPNKPWASTYVDSAYLKGVTRSYTLTHKKDLLKGGDFYLGGRAQFLRDSFIGMTAVKTLEMLYMRNYSELEGITGVMDQKISRILADGFAHGHSPRVIAKEMFDSIKKISMERALRLARTEVIRAHAEGQLDAFKRLGVEKLGVRAEWSTAGDDKVCSACGEMEGVIFTIDEARGLIPMHPNCRCMWIPADKNRKEQGQIWDKRGRRSAIAETLRKLTPTAKSLREAKNRSTWAGKKLL